MEKHWCPTGMALKRPTYDQFPLSQVYVMLGAVSTKIYPKPFCTNVMKQKKLHNTNQHSSRKNMRYLYVYLLHFTDNHRKPHQLSPHVVSFESPLSVALLVHGIPFGSRYSFIGRKIPTFPLCLFDFSMFGVFG